MYIFKENQCTKLPDTDAGNAVSGYTRDIYVALDIPEERAKGIDAAVYSKMY